MTSSLAVFVAAIRVKSSIW